MSVITDRRLNGKGKSAGNRAKLIRRHKQSIRDAVNDAINNKSTEDLRDGNTRVKINQKDLREPSFGHSSDSGTRDGVVPGNKQYTAGDRIPKEDGEGGQGRDGSNDPATSDDDFIFSISQEEFLDILFEDLALPNLVNASLRNAVEYVTRRGGFTTVGNPTNLNVIKSFEKSIARRIAMRSPLKRKLKQLCDERDAATCEQLIASLSIEIAELERRIKLVPFIDDFDLRYNTHIKEPIPATSAVMFCLMDVSGSMQEHEKTLAKKFFLLLYLFLTQRYDRVDIIRIRHHTEAKEVDETEFFHSRETGGTIVSTGLDKIIEIAKERYSGPEWNLYGAQCSDGDNWGEDTHEVLRLLKDEIFPIMQYFAYIETCHSEDSVWSSDGDSDLWSEYKTISNKKFAMKQVRQAADIYPVFRELFSKDQ